MKKSILMSLVLMFTFLTGVLAQTRAISGRVTDQASGEGLPGVTVLLKGTSTGISTNSDGKFTLSVPEAGGTLVFSSVGMATQERAIGTAAEVNIALAQDNKQLSEVVVTALGIEKDVRSLGYATQEIKADQISQKSEPNVLNALQGKVAGVNITGASGLAGSSTNINIRGISSLQGSNQPLFVVDGIPISNDLDRTNGGPLGTLGGAQTSNRANDIDPETIASINILKGPAAAALYGSRAASGAVIITTKSGRNAKGKTEVTVTSSYNVSNVYGLAKLQNDYGQGTQGVVVTSGGLGDVNTASRASYGPRFGTTPTLANGLLLTDGSTLPYQAYPDNIRDFYRQGRILNNGVNIVGGNADQNVSLNVNNTDQKGITENSSLKRTNVQLGGNVKLINKLRAGGSVSFIQTNQVGPLIGNGSSAFGQLPAIPRSYNLQGLPSQDPNTGGNIFFPGSDNPYFNLRNNPTTSNLTRFINVANLSYDVTPWLNVAYRAGLDTYTDRRKQIFALGSARVPGGQVLDQAIYRSEINGDLLVTLKKDNIITEGFNASLLLGQNINQRRAQSIQSQADALAFPFYNAQAGTQFTASGESSSVRRLLGYYAQLSLAYNNYLFLELTGRADQSSTLPTAHNTFFYPAATVGFVFSDAFKLSNDIFTYGKLRANVARVGKDAATYALETYYNSASLGNNVGNISFPFTVNGVTYPGFGISSALGGGTTLTPEFTKSFEAGTNLGFFNNRLTFDLSYFKTISENQIIPITTPGSTGYLSRVTNVGRVDNTGFEALMIVSPVRTTNFKWDINANFTHIKNEVISIAPDVITASVNGSAFIGSVPSFQVGQPYGIIIGSKVPRVPATDANGKANDPSVVGRYIINPATGSFDSNTVPNSILSNPNPQWQGGITNTVSYRGLSLSFLVDATYGAQLLSFTNAVQKSNGHLAETAVNREAPRVIPGVIRNPDGSYRENNIQIDAQQYYGAIGGLQSEFNVYDASVYRLREASIGYTLPKALLEKTPFGQASITLSGRNLFYYAPNANFDPETNTQGAGNIRGLELQGPPNTRNYGVNLRFTL
ncbi:SusC/RagA family TonB-linked outer membrane protein [Hymenobacter sp. UYCo722]|uniref:SusC/RagA family TonB-linked outer membrane protein n=1 Tax=Hymenobacter sp. UYCo722 TaxID=3156335 RepID=UPI00339A41FC